MSDIEYVKAFKANTTTKRVGDHWECECNKFLWSVNAPTKAEAQNNGSYYFSQYYGDGEYND